MKKKKSAVWYKFFQSVHTLTLTLPSSIYYTSPPSLSTRNLPPPFLFFFIEFFRAVVTIYPPAGRLEPAVGGGSGRGTTCTFTIFFTMFDKQQNPITTCCTEKWCRWCIQLPHSSLLLCCKSQENIKVSSLLYVFFYLCYLYYNDFTVIINIFIQGGKVINYRNCRNYFS